MPPTVIDIRRADDNRDVVHRAVQTLAEGRLVVFPTETVYGVGASARSAAGVERIYEVKQRSSEAPIALAVKSAEEALDYVPQPGRIAERLARRCWPGPVTLVVDQPAQYSLFSSLPERVRQLVSPKGTLGFRVPAHEIVLDVLRMLAGPIALTSANRSGEADAITADATVASLGDQVELVLDGGPCRYGQASTVVRATQQDMHCLREGVVSQTALERLSNMIILFVCTGNTCRSPMAEAIMRRLAAEKLNCATEALEQHGVTILSAGVAAAAGFGPSGEAVKVMNEKELNLTNHASQPLTDKLVRHADLILTLTGGHRQAVIRRWPECATRVETLRIDGQDINDPIGGSIAVYRECAEQIESALRERIDQLEFK